MMKLATALCMGLLLVGAASAFAADTSNTSADPGEPETFLVCNPRLSARPGADRERAALRSELHRQLQRRLQLTRLSSRPYLQHGLW